MGSNWDVTTMDTSKVWAAVGEEEVAEGEMPANYEGSVMSYDGFDLKRKQLGVYVNGEQLRLVSKQLMDMKALLGDRLCDTLASADGYCDGLGSITYDIVKNGSYTIETTFEGVMLKSWMMVNLTAKVETATKTISARGNVSDYDDMVDVLGMGGFTVYPETIQLGPCQVLRGKDRE